jgi:para-aminobenzoate synthetase component 1
MILREIDWRPPLAAFAPLSREPYACLLHASAAADWTILCAFPAATVEARGPFVAINERRVDVPALAALSKLAAQRARASASQAIGAPFLCGLAGYVGYECGAAIEPTAEGPKSPFRLPDLAFGAFDGVALFERRAQRAFVSARDERAAARIEEALGRETARTRAATFEGLASNFTQAAYLAMVADAVEMVRAGRFFQINLAQHVSAEAAAPLDPLALFASMAGGDAAFASYIAHRDGSILSNSPERFFQLAGTRIVAEPVKGTRPRGRTEAEDEALARELACDPKERAENVMIADLTRNDLSRVCEDGSIREEAICEIQTTAAVHHLVSRISGALRPGVSAIDALAALFPCGSVTGAPKIEAMKAIASFEGRGRGPYCGAIGFIDDRGGADFSVAIRTMMIEPTKDGMRATLPVGGGITLRSEPAREYEETWIKARSMLQALGLDARARP